MRGADDSAFVAREDRSKAALRLGGCLLMLAAGAWAASLGTSKGLLAGVLSTCFIVFALRYIWSLARPGHLRVGPVGVEEDLGWRRRAWDWSQISRITLMKTGFGMISFVLLRDADGRLLARLFGWDIAPPELRARLIKARSIASPGG